MKYLSTYTIFKENYLPETFEGVFKLTDSFIEESYNINDVKLLDNKFLFEKRSESLKGQALKRLSLLFNKRKRNLYKQFKTDKINKKKNNAVLKKWLSDKLDDLKKWFKRMKFKLLLFESINEGFKNLDIENLNTIYNDLEKVMDRGKGMDVKAYMRTLYYALNNLNVNKTKTKDIGEWFYNFIKFDFTYEIKDILGKYYDFLDREVYESVHVNLTKSKQNFKDSRIGTFEIKSQGRQKASIEMVLNLNIDTVKYKELNIINIGLFKNKKEFIIFKTLPQLIRQFKDYLYKTYIKDLQILKQSKFSFGMIIQAPDDDTPYKGHDAYFNLNGELSQGLENNKNNDNFNYAEILGGKIKDAEKTLWKSNLDDIIKFDNNIYRIGLHNDDIPNADIRGGGRFNYIDIGFQLPSNGIKNISVSLISDLFFKETKKLIDYINKTYKPKDIKKNPDYKFMFNTDKFRKAYEIIINLLL